MNEHPLPVVLPPVDPVELPRVVEVDPEPPTPPMELPVEAPAVDPAAVPDVDETEVPSWRFPKSSRQKQLS